MLMLMPIQRNGSDQSARIGSSSGGAMWSLVAISVVTGLT